MSTAGSVALVSVIVPSYNHEAYIEECLEAVVRQTYRPLELLVVDDCSSDSTMDVVERFVGSAAVQRRFEGRVACQILPRNLGAQARADDGEALAAVTRELESVRAMVQTQGVELAALENLRKQQFEIAGRARKSPPRGGERALRRHEHLQRAGRGAKSSAGSGTGRCGSRGQDEPATTCPDGTRNRTRADPIESCLPDGDHVVARVRSAPAAWNAAAKHLRSCVAITASLALVRMGLAPPDTERAGGRC